MTNKRTWALSLVLLIAGLVVPRLYAASLQDIKTEWYGQATYSETVANSSSSAVNLGYSGSSTESVVTITSFSIAAFAPNGTADTNFGDSGLYHFDTYTTMGALCDSIDADTGYSCDLRGHRRGDDPKFLKDQTAAGGTNDLKTAGGFNVYLDTGTFGALPGATWDLLIGITPQSGRRVVLKRCVTNVNVIGTIDIYGRLKKNGSGKDQFGATSNDNSLVWTAVTADDTDQTDPSANFLQDWIEFADNAHVVISAGNGTGIQGANATNVLTCIWAEK